MKMSSPVAICAEEQEATEMAVFTSRSTATSSSSTRRVSIIHKELLNDLRLSDNNNIFIFTHACHINHYGRPSMARLDWRSVYGIEKIRIRL